MIDIFSLILLVGGLVSVLVLTRQYFKARREIREYQEKVDAANEEAKRRWQESLRQRNREEGRKREAELTARNAAQQTINAAKGVNLTGGPYVSAVPKSPQKAALTEKQTWLSKSDDTEIYTQNYYTAPFHHVPVSDTSSSSCDSSSSSDSGSSSSSDSGCSSSSD